MNKKSIFNDNANEMMTHPKEQTGITLIALIITVVILIILAVVAITSVQNEGLFIRAEEAATKYNQSVKDENMTIHEYLNISNQDQTQKECTSEHDLKEGTFFLQILETTGGKHLINKRCNTCRETISSETGECVFNGKYTYRESSRKYYHDIIPACDVCKGPMEELGGITTEACYTTIDDGEWCGKCNQWLDLYS